MIERLAFGIGGVCWFLLCEYIRTKISNQPLRRFLGFLGIGGGGILLLFAVI